MKTKQIDLLGLLCPEPLMEIRRTIRHMEVGDRLEILADDPSTTRDIPSFCRHMAHRLVDQQAENPPFTYLIEKGE